MRDDKRGRRIAACGVVLAGLVGCGCEGTWFPDVHSPPSGDRALYESGAMNNPNYNPAAPTPSQCDQPRDEQRHETYHRVGRDRS